MNHVPHDPNLARSFPLTALLQILLKHNVKSVTKQRLTPLAWLTPGQSLMEEGLRRSLLHAKPRVAGHPPPRGVAGPTQPRRARGSAGRQ